MTVRLVIADIERSVPRDMTAGWETATRNSVASLTCAAACARRQSDATIEKPAPGISIVPPAAATRPRLTADAKTGHSPAMST
jgi:hypothetical protein